MKITKRYLKQIIKEEIEKIQEAFDTQFGVPIDTKGVEDFQKLNVTDRMERIKAAKQAGYKMDPETGVFSIANSTPVNTNQPLSPKQNSVELQKNQTLVKQAVQAAKQGKKINTGKLERQQVANMMNAIIAKYNIEDMQGKEASKSLRADAFKALQNPSLPAVIALGGYIYKLPPNTSMELKYNPKDPQSVKVALSPYEKYRAYKLIQK